MNDTRRFAVMTSVVVVAIAVIGVLSVRTYSKNPGSAASQKGESSVEHGHDVNGDSHSGLHSSESQVEAGDRSNEPNSAAGIRKARRSRGALSETVKVRSIPVEETPMAQVDPDYQEPAAEPFNKAAAALQSALSALDKSLVFNSFDGVYALAVCGDTYIVASNDGSSVIIRKSGEDQVFETASGTTCSFIGQKDDYYLAQIGTGGYVLTTPTGKEFTLSGAQNAEDASKPFTSSPAAADTISTIAYLQDELPRDHKLYTTPDKTLAVVSTGSRYIVVRNDGSSRELPSIATEGYRMQAESGTACALVAGSSDVAIGAPTEEALLIKAEDGSEVVVSQTAYGNEYTAVPSVYRDLNAIPPDLPSDPLFTPARLESADAILTMNEWELSLAEQRILRRLLADLAGDDPSANSL